MTKFFPDFFFPDKVYSFYKVFENKSPRYFFNIIPISNKTLSWSQSSSWNKNSKIVFKIRWIHYVSAVLELNQLHISCFTVPASFFLSTIKNIDCKLLEITDSSLTQMLLYGNPSFDIITNLLILNATFDLILSTKRFEDALF